MANRGLSDEEISLAKGMLALGMKRDVIHSFFVSPGEPITPAFVSEINSGKIGSGIEAASEEHTRAFINSRMAFKPAKLSRSLKQRDLFPDPPSDILSPHNYDWKGSTLVPRPYVNLGVKNDRELLLLLEESRLEIKQLLDDPALANHPRLTKRIDALSEALPTDITRVDPIKSGSRAKKVMYHLGISNRDFSAEFVGEITAAMSSVFMLVSRYEEWRQFEINEAFSSLAGETAVYEPAKMLASAVTDLPTSLVHEKVANSLHEFVEDAIEDAEGADIESDSLSILAAHKSSLVYSAIATLNQFAAVLVRAMRSAGSHAGRSAVEILKKIQEGAYDGIKSSSKFITSSVILLHTISYFKELALGSPEILGWLLPFLERLDDFLKGD